MPDHNIATATKGTVGWEYPVGEVGAEPGVAAQPLVRSLVALLDDVSSDHAAAVAGWCLPGERHCRLDLVTVVQVLRRTRSLCRDNDTNRSEQDLWGGGCERPDPVRLW